MDDRLHRALVRLAKIALLAVLPVLIASLQSGEVEWRALLTTGSVAVLAAVEKYLRYEVVDPLPEDHDEPPAPHDPHAPRA